MEAFHAGQVFSSIDRQGRYAWANQPRIGAWNLAQLAGALLPLIDQDEDKAIQQAQAVIDHFPTLYDKAYLTVFGAKLGLSSPSEQDKGLISDLLSLMQEEGADFTLTFRRMRDGETGLAGGSAWEARWHARMAESHDAEQIMAKANPVYIPRNHRIAEAISAANAGHRAPFDRLVEVLSAPYESRSQDKAYEAPARPDEHVEVTFCGT